MCYVFGSYSNCHSRVELMRFINLPSGWGSLSPSIRYQYTDTISFLRVDSAEAPSEKPSKSASNYQVKHQMLDDFLRQQLKNPTVRMKFA